MPALVTRLYTATERDRDRQLVETVAQILRVLGGALGAWVDDPGAGWNELDGPGPKSLARIAGLRVEQALLRCAPGSAAIINIADLVEAFGSLSSGVVGLILEASNAHYRLRGGQ